MWDLLKELVFGGVVLAVLKFLPGTAAILMSGAGTVLLVRKHRSRETGFRFSVRNIMDLWGALMITFLFFAGLYFLKTAGG